jgi:hypothetical protein
VALDTTGGTPANRRAGKIRNVLPPAKALAAPPAMAAASKTIQDNNEGSVIY